MREHCCEKRRLEQLDVCKQYSQFYFITIIYVEFLHSYILIPFVTLDRTEAGSSSSNRERIRAIQEELAGFLLDEVIAPTGEYHRHYEFKKS
jgi:hypothetical protein